MAAPSPARTLTGFVCAPCRLPLVTDASRPSGPRGILRARMCPRCYAVVQTLETVVSGGELLAAGRIGFFCRRHPDQVLNAENVLRPDRDQVVRYRRCPICTPGRHLRRRGPPVPGVPMLRTVERAVPVEARCATPLELLTRVCQGDGRPEPAGRR